MNQSPNKWNLSYVGKYIRHTGYFIKYFVLPILSIGTYLEVHIYMFEQFQSNILINDETFRYQLIRLGFLCNLTPPQQI
jgi:hypothetical protein